MDLQLIGPGRTSGRRASISGDLTYAIAHEDANGFAGNWNVTAFAICVDRPAGYEVVHGESLETGSESSKTARRSAQRLRARVVAEVRPQRQCWTEALLAIPGWPDAPCGYLELSPHYAAASGRARDQGWRYRHLRGGHFEMLVRPADVADAILELAGERRIGH